MRFLASDQTKTSDAPKKSSGSSGFSSNVTCLVERPGSEVGSWEQWIQEPGSAPTLLTEPLSRSSKHGKKHRRIVCLPTQSLHDWPLWIAGGGDPVTLARLELSGRHLIKRGMETSLGLFPINTEKDRQLVLAICPEEPFPEEVLPSDWSSAESFDLPVRTFGDESADLVIWSEWGRVHASFFLMGKPVWFCPVDASHCGGLLMRTSLRLRAEGIVPSPPKRVLLAGIPAPIRHQITASLVSVFPSATISWSDGLPPPRLPSDPLDIPPEAARRRRAETDKSNRLLSFITAGAILYTLLLLWGSADLLIHRMELSKIRKATAAVTGPASDAKADTERWKAMREEIDPSFYALDLLAAVASPTEGGKVRLTRFTLEPGKLQVSGEATDVTQAYAFEEQIKKNPALQAYEWTSGQPQLAGKNSVRFEMEGSRSDANTGPK